MRLMIGMTRWLALGLVALAGPAALPACGSDSSGAAEADAEVDSALDTGDDSGGGDLGDSGGLAESDVSAADAEPDSLPDSDGPDSDGPDSDGPDSDMPDSDMPDSDMPDSDMPDSDMPDSDMPDSDGPDSDGPDSGRADVAELDAETDAEMDAESDVAGVAPPQECQEFVDPVLLDCKNGIAKVLKYWDFGLDPECPITYGYGGVWYDDLAVVQSLYECEPCTFLAFQAVSFITCQGHKSGYDVYKSADSGCEDVTLYDTPEGPFRNLCNWPAQGCYCE